MDTVHPQRHVIWDETITKAMTEYELEMDLAYHDLTSLYFEGEYADSELVDYGYNRDGSPSSPGGLLNFTVTLRNAYQVPLLKGTGGNIIHKPARGTI